MAPRRLSDSEKQDLVGRYKAGESTSALAEAFGCSPNTVSRTVKALLPADAYAALKASRQKGLATPPPPTVTQAEEPEVTPSRKTTAAWPWMTRMTSAKTLRRSSPKTMTTAALKRSRSLFPCLGWEISVIAH